VVASSIVDIQSPLELGQGVVAQTVSNNQAQSQPASNSANIWGYTKSFKTRPKKDFYFTSTLKEAEVLKNYRANLWNENPDQTKELKFFEFKIERFEKGLKDNLRDLVELPESLVEALAGPDYFFEDTQDSGQIQKLKDRVVSLGHGGILELSLSQNQIVDRPGPDFFIFENIINYKGELFQELAFVEVSESLGGDADFKRFPCDPAQGVFEGCAGFVPTELGGDAFDLSKIGISKARRIRILDTGQNGQGNGFDLDSVKILHSKKLTEN
jgi:hypothetical protein